MPNEDLPWGKTLLVLLIFFVFAHLQARETPGPDLMCNVTSSQNNICPNTPIQLTHSGFGGGCNVTWYTGPSGTGSNLGTANPLSLSPVATTTYYARPNGLCNCAGEEQITVIVNKTFSAPGTAVSDTNLVCPNTPVKLTHSGFMLGSGASTVTWYDGPNGTGQSFGQANPIVATPFATTTYYAYSSGTCNDVQAMVTVTVDKSRSQVGVVASDTTDLCPGDVAMLSHSGFVAGSGAGSVAWYTGPMGTGTGLGTMDSLDVSPLTTTTYYAYLQGICNQVEDSITINAWPGVNADAGADQLICVGESVAIGGQPSGSGGTGPFSIVWDPSQTLSSATDPNPSATPLVTTVYSLSIDDSKGCKDSSAMTVTVRDLPVVQLVQTFDPTGCDRSDGEIQIDATATGGNLWYQVISLDDQDTLGRQVPVLEELTQGSYTVLVRYAQGPGCEVLYPDTFQLKEPPPPLAEILVAPEELCPFETSSFLATQDTGEVNYFWKFGSNASLDSAVGANIEGVFFKEEGNTTIRLHTERNDCISATTALTVILPIPEIRIGGASPLSDVVIMVASGASFKTDLSVSPATDLSWTAKPIVGEVKNLTTSGTGNLIQEIHTLQTGSDSAVIQYTVVTATGNCEDTATLRVRVVKPLFIPNLVTPNSDGWNDTWDIQVNEVNGYRPEDFSVKIFNRSGGQVYQGPISSPWTGEGSPDGTYWYQLYNASTDETITGSLTLIRN